MKTKIDLRRAIKERGFTIRDVAKKMGVQPPNITQNSKHPIQAVLYTSP